MDPNDKSQEVTNGEGPNVDKVKEYKDPIKMIKDFCMKRKEPEKQDALLPTLPNLYGLDVRFRYVEKIMKEEKDRRSVKGTSNSGDAEFLSEMFDVKGGRYEPPVNRHGNLLFDSGKKKKLITTSTYRMRRNL